MDRRALHWVNSPVLIQAIERYEQGLLPRSMQLWIEALLDLEASASGPLHPSC
jgi:hypothetical protein